jgi:hypothetical protein
MDASANDIPDERFDVKAYPAIYFIPRSTPGTTANGQMGNYSGVSPNSSLPLPQETDPIPFDGRGGDSLRGLFEFVRLKSHQTTHAAVIARGSQGTQASPCVRIPNAPLRRSSAQCFRRFLHFRKPAKRSTRRRRGRRKLRELQRRENTLSCNVQRSSYSEFCVSWVQVQASPKPFATLLVHVLRKRPSKNGRISSTFATAHKLAAKLYFLHFKYRI